MVREEGELSMEDEREREKGKVSMEDLGRWWKVREEGKI